MYRGCTSSQCEKNFYAVMYRGYISSGCEILSRLSYIVDTQVVTVKFCLGCHVSWIHK